MDREQSVWMPLGYNKIISYLKKHCQIKFILAVFLYYCTKYAQLSNLLDYLAAYSDDFPQEDIAFHGVTKHKNLNLERKMQSIAWKW